MKTIKTTIAALLCLFAPALWAQEAADEDGGIGLTPNVEAGLGNIADAVTPSVTPGVVYEHSFGAVDLYGEFSYTAAFADPAAHSLYLELEAGYNLPLGEANVLTFILNSKNTYRLAPPLEDGETQESVIEPSVLFTRTLEFGGLYGQAGCPVSVLSYDGGAETAVDVYLTLGWASTFGLGLELTGTFNIAPDADMAEYGALVSFERGIFYGEVEVLADKSLSEWTVNPEIDVSAGAWTFTARAELLLPTEGDAEVSPFIGIGYTF